MSSKGVRVRWAALAAAVLLISVSVFFAVHDDGLFELGDGFGAAGSADIVDDPLKDECDWDALFEAAPRPSNYRSVLTYLRDHPHPTETDYRKALNLITRRLLSLYLAAYQSLLWNRVAARYLAARLGET